MKRRACRFASCDLPFAKIKLSRSAITLILAVVLLSPKIGALAQSAPDFQLPRHDTGETIRLSDFAGQIVVLDFFAYWCAPCRVASHALEAEIQKFYSARHGNPKGIPIRVVSINIEKEHPDLTHQFISNTGASLVLDDFSGAVLKQFGATGIPYLAIIDASQSLSGSPAFKVVYAHAGFEGAARLRAVIDGINGSSLPSDGSGRIPYPPSDILGFWFAGPLTQRAEVDTEVAWTSDVFLTESAARFEQDLGKVRWDANVTYNSYDEDYQPFRPADHFGFAEKLHEPRYAGQATVRPKLAESLSLIVAGGAYSGFQDYRRVWLNNYYRQQFANPRFPPTPGYEEADPKGWNVSAGFRWEYLPTIAFLEVRGGYNVDDVAPGFVRDPATGVAVRGRARLTTPSLSLSTENVLSSRLRALNEIRLSDTTTRERRISWQGRLKCALGESWVLGPYGGYTTEAPKFEAFWLGLALEFELTRVCTLIAAGHYYRDTGEILDPLVLSSAAPGLQSYEASLGVRFTWSRVTLKLAVGPYSTHYEPVAPASLAFTNLYRDRHWGLAQATLSVAF